MFKLGAGANKIVTVIKQNLPGISCNLAHHSTGETFPPLPYYIELGSDAVLFLKCGAKIFDVELMACVVEPNRCGAVGLNLPNLAIDVSLGRHGVDRTDTTVHPSKISNDVRDEKALLDTFALPLFDARKHVGHNSKSGGYCDLCGNSLR